MWRSIATAIEKLVNYQTGQAVIGTGLILGTFILMFERIEVPTWLIGFDALVVGYLFGNAVGNNHNTSGSAPN